MLENFKGYDQGTFTIERVEYTLWQHLLSLRLPYQLDYGDYATVRLNRLQKSFGGDSRSTFVTHYKRNFSFAVASARQVRAQRKWASN